MLTAQPAARRPEQNAGSSVEEDKIRRRRSMADERKRRRSTLPGRLPMDEDGEGGGASGQPKTPGSISKLLSPEEMGRKFEEWMKIAADNKINAANSWNLALIDYFYDMNILREGDSINFQKASCTLDGCVKIYTSRVDSVATETGKLLSGLADSAADDGNRDGDGEGDGEEAAAPKKKISRTVKTLLEDFTSLNTKKFDLDFTVDPLFKKTCADFDEGGARGLLLNHLSISNHGMIIFDAGDAVANHEDDDEELEAADEENIDLGKLLDKFPMGGRDLVSRRICPSLESFSFESGTYDPIFQAASNAFDPAADHALDDVMDLDPGLLEDDMDMVSDGPEDYDGGAPDDYGHREEALLPVGGAEAAWTDALEAPFFDEKALRNWAGPEHWRLRPLKAPPRPADHESKRREKKEFLINFLEDAPADVAVLFAPASSIPTLPREAGKKPQDRHLLPEDLHFSASDLFTLFVRPHVKVMEHESSRVRCSCRPGLSEGQRLWKGAAGQRRPQASRIRRGHTSR
ncbi:condensin complex subunit 2/barren [Hyaloraphidium curvatum]|nr:condensin complex subunit 2/barren [Hyaloraphidium curvatum]